MARVQYLLFQQNRKFSIWTHLLFFSKINSAVLILYLRGIFNWHLGLTVKLMANRARPILKTAKMALFYQWMKFEIFLGQMTSFEVLWICHFVILSKICLRLYPSAYLSINLGIKWIISRIPCGISKFIFVQGCNESLAMLDQN